MYLNRLAVFCGTLFLNGCAPDAYDSVKNADVYQPSFCEVAQNLPQYLGVEVKLDARYISDSRHEEVLEDVACSDGRRIIDVGKHGASESVANFYAEIKRICSARGATYLCNTSADVKVFGTINMMSGEYVLDIKEISSYSFIDPWLAD